MQPRVIFEDESVLVLDKPAGWIVNEAETTKGQPVIQTWLFNNFDYPSAKDKTLRSGIVHRLDKETSGVLAAAKRKSAFENLQSQFKRRLVEKQYTALVHGKVEPKKGKIEVPVGRLPWDRKKFGIVLQGRKSETSYSVETYIKGENGQFSLVSFAPKTGRTHQIRVHAKYLGHPIVADATYAGRKTARSDRKWCPRLFLHAGKLSFNHPATKRRVSFESSLPQDLKNVLGLLAKNS